ncbi:hypothetical protein Trydic_g19136 [Trypoxylus dichotomus]
MPIRIAGNCNWEGDFDELYAHCEAEHNYLTFENFEVEIDLVSSYEENYVFCQANETFVVQLKSDNPNHKFYCNVRYCGLGSAAKNFSYRVCFFGKKKKFSCSVQSVQPNEIGSVICENTTSIDFMDILENLTYPICITCKIDIFLKKNVKVEPEEVEKAPEENDILAKLECPICLEFMVPPIMQCNAGHSFCQSCQRKIDSCPTCKGPINDTRNYLLEDITSIVSYPCKYKKYGCDFHANAEMIKNHEVSCVNGPYECVVDDCHWADKHSKLIKHLQEAHKDNILDTSMVNYIIDNTIATESYNYVIILDGNVFKVQFLRDQEEFLWTIYSAERNQIGNDDVTLILDFNSPTKERLYVQRKRISQALVFHVEHVSEFIENNVLAYKMQLISTK